MRSLVIYIFHQIFFGLSNQLENVRRDTYPVWERGEVYTYCWWGSLRKIGQFEIPDLDERIILEWVQRKWKGGIDWIDVAQGRSRWLEFVNAVINLLVP